MKNYFIKEGYKHKDSARTAVDSGSQYWSKYRLSSSKYYQHHVYKLAQELIIENKLNSCVDVGCGSGYKLVNLISPFCKDTTGIDQPFIIERCKKVYGENNINWLSEDFENAKIGTNKKFDLIICSDVIEHLLDPDILLNYLKSISHKDSIIIISTPERDILHGSANNSATNVEHIREWNQTELTAYIESSGFNIKGIHLLRPLKFHLNRLYFSHLKRFYKRFNYCMAIVCQPSRITKN